MLRSIRIKNFAIIDELELEFARGMSALTGETGAGKSILIEALGLALGERADASVVRAGNSRTEVEAVFDITGNALARERILLDEVCLKRSVGADGRSRAYINGEAIPLEQVRLLAETLIEIHGQHFHQRLLKRDAQRQIVDEQAGNRADLALLEETYRSWRHWDEHARQLELERDTHAQKLGSLRREVAELETLDLKPDELPDLVAEQARLAHCDALKETSLRAHHALFDSEEQSVDGGLNETIRLLSQYSSMATEIGESVGLLESARAQAREAADTLRRFGERLELDPERLALVDNRLAQIHAAARKQRVPPEMLSAKLDQLKAALADLEGPQWDVGNAAAAAAEAEARYRTLALSIRARRKVSAEKIQTSVSASMAELGMAGGRFEINLSESEPAAHGMDSIEFLVSANPGQPVRALAKVASGGELSRISLALQMAALEGMATPTLIFDEVDSGIGGAVAEIVGRKLRALGEQRQVFCVTHLPQVAAQAHAHLQVRKTSISGGVTVRISDLRESERTEEIARMLGGIALTEQTRAHASEMIERARPRNVEEPG